MEIEYVREKPVNPPITGIVLKLSPTELYYIKQAIGNVVFNSKFDVKNFVDNLYKKMGPSLIHLNVLTGHSYINSDITLERLNKEAQDWLKYVE